MLKFYAKDNTSLTLLQGEEFKDCRGYWGYYSVSNYGRVKSEKRIIPTKDGRQLNIKEKILTQNIDKKTGEATVVFSVDNRKFTKRVTTLVAKEFLREKEYYEFVVHLNKDRSDNRLENLTIMKKSESTKLDYELGVKKDWGISSVIKENRKQYEKKHFQYKNGELVKILCKNCGEWKNIDEYHYRYISKNRHTCKMCRNIEKAKYSQSLRFECFSFAKLVYDYLCLGNRVLPKNELKQMAKDILDKYNKR